MADFTLEDRTYSCPVELTLSAIGGRWKSILVCHLLGALEPPTGVPLTGRQGLLRRRWTASGVLSSRESACDLSELEWALSAVAHLGEFPIVAPRQLETVIPRCHSDRGSRSRTAAGGSHGGRRRHERTSVHEGTIDVCESVRHVRSAEGEPAAQGVALFQGEGRPARVVG